MYPGEKNPFTAAEGVKLTNGAEVARQNDRQDVKLYQP